MTQIPDEVVERLSQFARRMAAHAIVHGPFVEEAREIVALLPEPVDPDLIEAREVVCGYHHDKYPESPWHIGQAENVRSGRWDAMLDVQAAYHGIRRGRELERAERAKGGAL